MNTERSRSGRSISSRVGTLEAHGALLHEHRPLGERECDVDGLLDHHDGDAVASAAGAPRRTARTTIMGDRPERELVDEQDLRAQHQGHRHGQLLLLTTGEVAGQLGTALGQHGEQIVYVGDRVRRSARRPCGRSTLDEAQVVVHRHGREDRLAPGHERDALADDLFGGTARRGPRPRLRTVPLWGARPQMARSSVDLPAPLVPSSATTSPSADVQVDVEEDLQLSVGHVDPGHLEQPGRRPSRQSLAAGGSAAVGRTGPLVAQPFGAAVWLP